jgi:non-heme chloroperoxidase
MNQMVFPLEDRIGRAPVRADGHSRQLRFATMRLATGPLVHYAEQGDPGGETLVFLHGYPDSWFSFSRLLPLLDPAWYRAYAIDQRGFGHSERPADGYAIDDFAADVTSFLDAVGADRATLVGHSMGSFIARRVAETRPERVARLVLIGSAVTPVNEVTLEVRAAVRTLEDPVAPAFAREFAASTVHVPLPEPFFERIVAESVKPPARVWRSAWDGLLAFDDAADLGRIAAPTLLLWGEQDAVFPGRREQERLAAAIPGARLTVYPETGHCPNWERPERVADDLAAFVREPTSSMAEAGGWPAADLQQ